MRTKDQPIDEYIVKKRSQNIQGCSILQNRQYNPENHEAKVFEEHITMYCSSFVYHT